MRLRNLVIVAAFGAALTGPTWAQTADKYQQLSAKLVGEATAAMAADRAVDAQALLERALVANPANLEALIALGKAHEAQGRVASGLKYYRKALEIEPNDKAALERQAIAYLKRNLSAKAELNREKLARICQKGCDALENVASAIDEYRAKHADAGSKTAETKKDS